MHRARAFFYVCAGIFLLGLSYHLGAQSARAQSAGTVVGMVASGPAYAAGAITSNGDVYTTSISALDHGWTFKANIFGGGGTPTRAETLGQLKARYR